MHRMISIIFLSLVFVLGPTSGWSQTQPAAPLERTQKTQPQTLPKLDASVTKLLEKPGLKESKIGITVLDAESGEILADYHGNENMNPASNQKLVTSIVAFDHFPPGMRQTTTIEGEVDANGVVNHGLIIRASGDTTIDEGVLLELANQLKKQGIREVKGGIIVDVGPLGSGLPPAFEQKNEDAAYRASVSGFSLLFNGIYTTVTPSKVAGQPPTVIVSPLNEHVKIINQAKTVQGHAWPKITVSHKGSDIVVSVTGKSGQKSGSLSRKNRLEDPTRQAAFSLMSAIKALGIKVSGDVDIKRVPLKQPLLAEKESRSLAEEVYLMNKFSNNFIAEMLFRRLGTIPDVKAFYDNEPAWIDYSEEQSLKSYRHTLNKALKGESIVVKNGSGLYDGNLISTRNVAKLLYYASKQPWSAELRASLPIASQDGSLKNRFKKSPLSGNLYAKTGTLNQVIALSGYTTGASGKPIIISVIFNDTPKYAWLMRREQDEIVEALMKQF